MNSINDYNFQSKRALVRVDFNVPLDKDTLVIKDDTRILKALPTLKKILNDGGSLVIMSHLGRPKNGPEGKLSLKHLVQHLSDCLSTEIHFFDDCIGKEAFNFTENMPAGSVVLLENLRFYKQETTGTVDFAQQLSKHGDVYVNDAFGTAHRAHASTTIVAQFFAKNKLFGYLLEKEINSVKTLLETGEKPVMAIVGGAKVSSKIAIIENLLPKIDRLIIGGGMTYTFVKAQEGKVGSSLVEDDQMETALKILKAAEKANVEVFLPEDTIAADTFSNDAEQQSVNTNAIPDGWMGLDIGIRAQKKYTTAIENSKTILWNGPMGVFEFSNFENGTRSVAEAIATATKNGAFSLIGGGDSVSAINQFKLGHAVTHVSTGGGAMLEFLEGKELPGIKAIIS